MLTRLGCIASPSLFTLQTTIIAVQYDGGVVLGADSRTSTGACAPVVSALAMAKEVSAT
jgi:ATP-dependent protease HslVU (ClpYQ) peptidase subunit